MNDDERHVLRDAVYVLFKRRLRIMIFALAGLAAGLAYNHLGGTRYTASARVLVTASAGAAAPSGAGQGPGPTVVFEGHGQTARNQAELFRDPGVTRRLLPSLEASMPRPVTLEADARNAGPLKAWSLKAWARKFLAVWLPGAWDRVLSATGLQQDLDTRLSNALSVSAAGDTDVVVLRFTWPDRAFAADALNQLLAGYEGSITQAADARQAMKVADAALREALSQVRTFDAQLAALPVGDDAVNLERERDRIQSRLAAAHADADALRVDREIARRKLDTVEEAYRSGGWVDSPDAADTPAEAPALQQTFVTLLDKHQMMLSRLPPSSPGVRDVDKQISRVREQNYQAVRQVLAAKLAAVNDRLARLNTDIAADEASAQSVDDRRVKVEALSQARAGAAAQAAIEQRRFDDAKLLIDAVGREVSGLRVLSPAMPPSRPDPPAPFVVAALATLGGLLAGIAAAFLAELGRRTIDRPRDIARLLELDVLARVPDLR